MADEQKIRWTVEPTSWGSFHLRDSVTGRAGFSSKDRGDLEQLATTLNVQYNAASVVSAAEAYRRKESLIAAALAWREADKRMVSFNEKPLNREEQAEWRDLAPKVIELGDALRIACDRYVEAQEK